MSTTLTFSATDLLSKIRSVASCFRATALSSQLSRAKMGAGKRAPWLSQRQTDPAGEAQSTKREIAAAEAAVEDAGAHARVGVRAASVSTVDGATAEAEAGAEAEAEAEAKAGAGAGAGVGAEDVDPILSRIVLDAMMFWIRYDPAVPPVLSTRALDVETETGAPAAVVSSAGVAKAQVAVAAAVKSGNSSTMTTRTVHMPLSRSAATNRRRRGSVTRSRQSSLLLLKSARSAREKRCARLALHFRTSLCTIR